MADIVTATLVGRGDVWANVRNAKEEMEICARVLTTMMVLTAYQTKLRSTWSSCDEEIRQHPEKAWPLISPRQIRGLDLGGHPHIRVNHKQHDDIEEVRTLAGADLATRAFSI